MLAIQINSKHKTYLDHNIRKFANIKFFTLPTFFSIWFVLTKGDLPLA